MSKEIQQKKDTYGENNAQNKFISYNEITIRRLALSALVMYIWILIWALVLKLGDAQTLIRNYQNLSVLTLKERIMWDLIPFNYRGTDYWMSRQMIDTILNCLVLAPLAVAFQYLFKKRNILRDAAICLGFSLLIESIQLATILGNPATEDLITNTLGCFIGIAVYHIIFKRLSVKGSVRFLAIVNVVFAAVVIFSITTIVRDADLFYKLLSQT